MVEEARKKKKQKKWIASRALFAAGRGGESEFGRLYFLDDSRTLILVQARWRSGSG